MKILCPGGSAGTCLEPYVVLEVTEGCYRTLCSPYFYLRLMIRVRRCRAELDQGQNTLGMILLQCEQLLIYDHHKQECLSEITSQSSEVLFEVWDQGQKIGKSDAFLGLAIGEQCFINSSCTYPIFSVSVAELMVTSSQRHVVPLQGRPYEEDQVLLCIFAKILTDKKASNH